MIDINNRITGFADEIANELEVQVEAVKKLGMSHIEMRGVDGNNLIYHTDEKVKQLSSDNSDIRPLLVTGDVDDYNNGSVFYNNVVGFDLIITSINALIFSTNFSSSK